MDHLGDILQDIGFHAAISQYLLPMYLHLIIAALFPIFTGAHASLSRPSSAAKPPKKVKKSADDVDPEEEQKMEGFSPMDAILLPITGGMSLVGLYYLIKYLEDPALLNKILNWYFAFLGTFALARLLADTASTIWSFIFPNTYQQEGEIWKADSKARKVWAIRKTQLGRESPLPHYLAFLPLSSYLTDILWNVRSIPSRKFRIKAYIYNSLKTNFYIGPFGLTSFVVALAFELYFNLIAKPWWLTNLLGFSVSYAALQLISPTTAWTGTLILGGLFFYDIYFVFFTPVMVTVATKMDIPAKLLFPRPGTNHLSMLGLGDVVLPGMIIGFALRFDLFLFYLRKQEIPKSSSPERLTNGHNGTEVAPTKDEDQEVIKAKYFIATGGWGERFWTPEAGQNAAAEQGGRFPKTYFYATLVGYVIGLIFTLGIMQVFGHAQPALLYLVPGVLCALWGTAFLRGEIQTLWNFRDDVEEDKNESVNMETKKEDEKGASKTDWMDWFIVGRIARKMEEKDDASKKAAQKTTAIEADEDRCKVEKSDDDAEMGKKDQDAEGSKAKPPKWDGQLVSFSISLPQSSA